MSRKNTLPTITSGGGVGKKILGGLIAAALLMLVVRNPADAAEWAKNALHAVLAVIDGLASFFRQLG